MSMLSLKKISHQSSFFTSINIFCVEDQEAIDHNLLDHAMQNKYRQYFTG